MLDIGAKLNKQSSLTFSFFFKGFFESKSLRSKFLALTADLLLLINEPSKVNNRIALVFLFKLLLLRKEVIQPHLPVRLPCYDFTPLTRHTFGTRR